MHQKVQYYSLPPTSIFQPINNCYDISVEIYFSLLKAYGIFSITSLILSLPAFYFSLEGQGLFKQFKFTLETMTFANLSLDYIKNPQDSYTQFRYVFLVVCDFIECVIFLCILLYFRIRVHLIRKKLHVDLPQLNDWAVKISGFPRPTIDSDDLSPLFSKYNIQEIVLVRDFQKTMFLQRERIYLERSIKLEQQKLKILTSKLSSTQIYTRQSRIELMKEEVAQIVKQIAKNTGLYFSPDDMDSILAYVVFSNKLERDEFFNAYNYNFFLRHGCFFKMFTQNENQKLRGIHKIKVENADSPSEIRWENMDFINENKQKYVLIQIGIIILLSIPPALILAHSHLFAHSDPVTCYNQVNSYCISEQFQTKEFFIKLGCGIIIVFFNEIALIVLKYVIIQERQVFIVKEQVSLFLRGYLILTFNYLVVLLIMDTEFLGIRIGYYITQIIQQTDIINERNQVYSKDLDRQWILNSGIKLIWISIFHVITNFLIKTIQLSKREKISEEDHELINNIIQQEQQEKNYENLKEQEERQQISEMSINQSSLYFLQGIIQKISSSISSPKPRSQTMTFKSYSQINQTVKIRRDSPLINKNSNFDQGERLSKFIISQSLYFIFCCPLPFLSLCGVLSISLQFFSDKYMLLKYHSYNLMQGVRLQREYLSITLLALRLLALTLLFHLFVSITMFGSDQFFPHNDSLGIIMNQLNSEHHVFQFPYRALKVLPLFIIFIFVTLFLLVDLLIPYLITNKINRNSISTPKTQYLQDYLPKMEYHNLLVSYDLRKNEEYQDIIFNSKKSAIKVLDQLIDDQKSD